MDRNRYAIVPGTNLVGRFLWLVGVPTGSCLAAWGVFLVAGPHHTVTAQVVAAGLHLLGLVGVLGYRWFSRAHVALSPYLPFALGAVVFAATGVKAPSGTREIAMVLPDGVGFLLPMIAFACGLCAFTLVDRRTRA